jgi:hypothetical protein
MKTQIEFVEGTEDSLPTSENRVSDEDVKAIEKIFQTHLASRVTAGTDPVETAAVAKTQPTKRQPCHIIACYVGKNGMTCYYHCV